MSESPDRRDLPKTPEECEQRMTEIQRDLERLADRARAERQRHRSAPTPAPEHPSRDLQAVKDLLVVISEGIKALLERGVAPEESPVPFAPSLSAPVVPTLPRVYPRPEKSSSREIIELQSSAKKLLKALEYDRYQEISPRNPRHLEGLVQRLNDPATRITFIDELSSKFRLHGESFTTPQWIFDTRKIATLEMALNRCLDLEELRRFCEFLQEIRHEAVMSRYDMSSIGPREVALKTDSKDYVVMTKSELRKQRRDDEASLLRALDIARFEEIGDFDAPNGLYSFLVHTGVIAGHPTFPEYDIDIVSANLRVLLRATEEKLINPKADKASRRNRLLLFYKRRPSNEYPQMLEDYGCISEGHREWRLNTSRMDMLTNEK